MKAVLLSVFLCASSAFAQLTTPSTTWATGVDGGAQTQVVLASGTGVVNGMTLWSGREGMLVTGNPFGTTFSVFRGSAGRAQRHAAGSLVYTVPTGYGVFVSMDMGPGNCLATDYQMLPLINTSSGNPWNCTGGVWVNPNAGGAVAGGYVFAVGLLCSGPCAVGETTNWKWTPPNGVTVLTCIADAQTYPTGAGSLTIDVRKNGSTSIFGTNPVITMTSATAAAVTATPQGTGPVLNGSGDYLLFQVLTVTAGTTGQFVNVTCKAS